MSHITKMVSTSWNALLSQINSVNRKAALTVAPLFLTLCLTWILYDFRAWKSFGTGGTPPTWPGYWRMTKIRINRILSFGKNDLRDPSPLSGNGPRFLEASSIDTRNGDFPRVMSRTMPQRQVPYKAKEVGYGVADRMTKAIGKIAAAYPELVDLRPSKTEGGSVDAIYAKPSLPTLKESAKGDPILTTEIAHVHPADRSLHVWLTEADAKFVISKRWGLRFPLGWVDKGFIMVYAPRTMEEVDIVERIIKAGIANVTGVKV